MKNETRQRHSEGRDVMKRLVVLLLLLPLAGCSYTMYLSGADERGGTVNLVPELGMDDALEKANDHCHQYNRVARVISRDQASSTIRFACQPPG
jgi:hypothetical protein